MDASTAARLVNQLACFPEWKLQAAAEPWLAPEGTILLTFSFPTRNTIEDHAPGYPQKFTASPGHYINVIGLDEDQLYAEVADFIIRAWEHETREALRVPPTREHPWWRAPFHPHRRDGQYLWARLHHPGSPLRQQQSVLDDERFGND